MAKDDFFLSFGTDADVFASKIEAESDRAAGGINRLIDALEDYEGTINKAQQGGPLRNLFGALDQAAQKFGTLTNQLVGGFDKALSGVALLTDELAGLVDAVNKINELKPKAKQRTATATAQITDEEIVATDNARRSSKALGEVIELNATAARNALKRVADINNTVARNSNSAADGLKELARQIRELNGAAKEAKGRGTFVNAPGAAGNQIIVVQGGTVQAGDGSTINVADILTQAAAASPKPAASPRSDQELDQAVRAEAKRLRNSPEALEDLTQPARSGLFTYPGSRDDRKGGRLVGADIREGETFEQYFARNDAVRSRIEDARANLPKPDRADLVDFNQFKLSGGKARDFANDLEGKFLRALQEDKTGSAITAESIKASLTDLGLEQQYPALPGIIERIFKVRAEQRAAAEKVIRELIAEDAAVTFGGGAFGAQNTDFEVGNTFPAALAKVDEELLNTHEGDPETVRLAQARRDAAEKRKLFRGRPEYVVDPGTLKDDGGTPDQEGLTLKQRQKEDVKRRKDNRARNKAAVDALAPIDPESVRARRKGNPELQRINTLLSKGSLSTSELADVLGLQTVSTRVPAGNEAELLRAAEARERAQTRLEAFDVDPEAYTARERAAQAAKAETFRNFDHPGSDLVVRDAQRRADTLTPEKYRAELEEELASAARDVRTATTHREVQGITDTSQADARAILERRRSEILAETAAPKPSVEEADANYRTIYRGSHEPLDLTRIGPEGLRTTQNRSYAEEHGGDKYLYRARVPASAFEVSPFSGEEVDRRFTREEIEAFGGFEQIVGPDAVRNDTTGDKRPKRTGVLKEARAKVADLEEKVLNAEGEAKTALEQELAEAQALVDELRQARAPKEGGGAGGGGRKPPPPNAAAAGEPEPDEGAGRQRGGVFDQDTSKKKNQSTSRQFQTDYSEQLALLQPTTRAILEDARARLIDTQAIEDQTERIRQQDAILVRAGAAFKNDPAFKSFPNLTTARGTFAQGVGLPPSKDNYNTLQQLFTRGGAIDASGLVNTVRKVTDAAGGGGGATPPGGLLGRKLFGERGFLDAQLRHIGLAIENFAGFQLVFTGFEKLKELVETGIQADAAFVRLQASINAAGRSVGNLREQLEEVSSRTATSLHDTIEAASELSGVFKNNADLAGGTQVATELSNISQGALTAKESAVGLRDVIDAYGLTGVKSVRQVGDEIARLSQTTGVSVKDILEGTTQLAQEAKQFGLGQRQASVLAAYVTRSTGETGEAAAEQVSRILSTLDNGNVQTALERIRNPKTGQALATPEQFSQGKIGEVLGNVLQNYDDLEPGQQSQIRALIGTGRQARALAGLLRDATAASNEFNNSSKDQGSLAAQNQRFLQSLAGVLKTLSTDFKNLGATLQQSGFFNIIGIFAKGLDEVLRLVTKILNTFNEIANSNPFTKAIKDVGILVAEVALLFKIASGSLGTLAGYINPNRRRVPVTARDGSAILDAEGRAATQFAPLAAREVYAVPGRIVRGARTAILTAGTGVDELGYDSSLGYGAQVRERRTFRNTFNTQRLRNIPAAAGSALRRAAGGEALDELGYPARLGYNPVPIQRGIFGQAGRLESISPRLNTVSGALNRFSGGLLASTAAMVALTFIIDKLSAAEGKRKEIKETNATTYDDLSGETARKQKAKNEGKDTDETPQQKAADKANNPGIVDVIDDRLHGDTEYDPNTIGGVDIGFDRETFSFDKLLNKRLRSSRDKITAAGDDAGKRKEAAANLEDQYAKGEKDIEEQAKFIKSLGLNPKQEANALAQLELSKKLFEESYAKLHALADGINDIDRLNIQQVENLNAALQESANLTPETLQGELGDRIKKSILANSGLGTDSQAYKDLEASLDSGQGGESYLNITQNRLQAQVSGDEEALKNAQEAVDVAPKDGGDEAKRATAARDAAATKLQADRKALRDLIANDAQTEAQIAIGTGDTKGALSATQNAIDALTEANSHLAKDDPEYLANLQKINELKKQFADQTYESAILADDLAAASSNDPLVKAQKEYDKALQQQKSVESRPHSAAEEEQAKAGVASAAIQQAQAEEDLRVAQYQQSIAGTVENSVKDQSQLNEILAEEQKYASGTLANSTKLAQLKAQEAEARQKLADTLGEEKDAAIEAQVAELQARGQAGDAEAAAKLQVSEIEGQMQRYLAKPGAKKTDAAYQRLVGQLATARRNAFDTALQAQLDTLDFQRETYQITSAQEVQALQQILKNKQLTLKEQRDITLKIKNLQESIRQQLTGGGFNIPSDIKLPTAYQVRRSLGGNQGSGGTTVNNVTNATNQVTVNNNVPTATVAQQIANQVINLINSQTSQSARANTSTPRLVGA